MDGKKIIKLRKRTLITSIIVSAVIFIPIVVMLITTAIGPKEISGSALLDEQVIRYMGNDYLYVGFADDVKSGRCIKRGLFESYYLNEGGREYIIRSSLHERHIFKREDLIENRYKLLSRSSENVITYEDDMLVINGDEYRLIDTFDRFEGRRLNYECYCSVGKVSFKSELLDVCPFENDYDCNFVCIQDDSFIVYVFAKTDVNMDAYTAGDASKVTSFYVNTKDYGNIKYDNPDVVSVLKSLRNHESSILYSDVFDYRPQGEYLFFDLIFDDLPICYKCRINITLCDDGVYYIIEDGTQDCYNLYKVSDDFMEKVLCDFSEELPSD